MEGLVRALAIYERLDEVYGRVMILRDQRPETTCGWLVFYPWWFLKLFPLMDSVYKTLSLAPLDNPWEVKESFDYSFLLSSQY
jgi:hypothetical protein